MKNYIDSFVFPIAKKNLEVYTKVSEQVAEIWKEYGALSYQEFLGDDLTLKGTKSFGDSVALEENEVVIFGWVVFPNKEVRDRANEQVPLDSRMDVLVAPLVNPKEIIFNAERMIYGGFKALISSDE